jgi:probable F420-dependent oxidoreductase
MIHPGIPAPPLQPYAAWLRLEAQTTDVSRSAARAVESLGFSALWVPETPTSREAFTHAGILLAATETLIVGTGIASIWARDATATAAAAHTLSDAYEGRLIVGLGISHAVRAADRGHQYEKPFTHMSRYLDAVETAGPFTPPPRRPARTVLAALGPRMQELARDRTDGVHSFFVTPEHTKDARSRLGAGSLLIPQQAFVIGSPGLEDRAVARAFVASRLALPNYVQHLLRSGFDESDLADGGTDRLVDAMVAIGSASAVAERMRAHLYAGATQVAAHPLIETEGGVVQLEALAAELLPTPSPTLI